MLLGEAGTVKAEWNQDGRQVTREKTVPVHG
jgi:hypothetical protein